MPKFRRLYADEIDCRVQTLKEDGCSVLLYKDARVDQIILDETVGAMNWERKHSRDNANCTVSIWDADKAQWVSKEDTGTESQTEAEKGLASDSFKRACFNWGIGRELYTAPFIWINCKNEADKKTGKLRCPYRFKVSKIGYDDRGNINQLVIVNQYFEEVFTLGGKTKSTPKKEETRKEEPKTETVKEELVDEKDIDFLVSEMNRTGTSERIILYNYKVKSLSEMTKTQFENAVKIFKGLESKGAK